MRHQKVSCDKHRYQLVGTTNYTMLPRHNTACWSR